MIAAQRDGAEPGKRPVDQPVDHAAQIVAAVDVVAR